MVVLSFSIAREWCRMDALRKICHKQISLLFVKRIYVLPRNQFNQFKIVYFSSSNYQLIAIHCYSVCSPFKHLEICICIFVFRHGTMTQLAGDQVNGTT